MELYFEDRYLGRTEFGLKSPLLYVMLESCLPKVVGLDSQVIIGSCMAKSSVYYSVLYHLFSIKVMLVNRLV